MNFLSQMCSWGPRVHGGMTNPVVPIVMQQRFAARKGTRERKRKLHKKKVIEKTDWVSPRERRAMMEMEMKGASARLRDKNNWPPVDDVFRQLYYKRIKWTEVSDATTFFRQYFHPTTRNEPNSLLSAYIELDLRLPKRSANAMQRYLDPFGDIVNLPVSFESPVTKERSVIAFAKSPEAQEAAVEGGAASSGGISLIKDVQSGERDLNDFAYFIAHPDIAIELASLRGVMKKKFPSTKNGALNADLKLAAMKFSRGLEYQVLKSNREPDLGVLNLPIGRLLLGDDEIEANLRTILNSILRFKPEDSKRVGALPITWPFINHVLIEIFAFFEIDYLNDTVELSPGQIMFAGLFMLGTAIANVFQWLPVNLSPVLGPFTGRRNGLFLLSKEDLAQAGDWAFVKSLPRILDSDFSRMTKNYWIFGR
ncbi:unnamed protein product, partial [Notodromas monacha]